MCELETRKPPAPIGDIPYPYECAVLARGVWEHIFAIIKHLKAFPTEVWEDDPSIAPIEHPKIRRLVLKKLAPQHKEITPVRK